jgi:hypothetical protein
MFLSNVDNTLSTMGGPESGIRPSGVKIALLFASART